MQKLHVQTRLSMQVLGIIIKYHDKNGLITESMSQVLQTAMEEYAEIIVRNNPDMMLDSDEEGAEYVRMTEKRRNVQLESSLFRRPVHNARPNLSMRSKTNNSAHRIQEPLLENEYEETESTKEEKEYKLAEPDLDEQRKNITTLFNIRHGRNPKKEELVALLKFAMKGKYSEEIIDKHIESNANHIMWSPKEKDDLKDLNIGLKEAMQNMTNLAD